MNDIATGATFPTPNKKTPVSNTEGEREGGRESKLLTKLSGSAKPLSTFKVVSSA